jgi:AraC family transcriptional regulator, arabinose operon regulatory protein
MEAVSDRDLRKENRGAYGNPFSGVGVEFLPLNVLPDHSGVTLHEAGYLADNYWWNFPNVFSPFWRLYCNDRPGHRVIFADREVELTPDRLILIPDRQTFHCRGENSVSTFWLAFSVERHVDAHAPMPIVLRPRTVERRLIGEIRRLFDRGGHTAHRERVMRYGIALIQAVLARDEIPWATEVTPEGIRLARQHMEANCARRLSNGELARRAGMSEGGFVRAFRRHTGLPPAQYVTRLRIRDAAHRLAHTQETIESIAAAAGFPNRAYFTRVFAKVLGKPPAAFRRGLAG